MEFDDLDDYTANRAEIGQADLILVNSAEKLAGFSRYPTKIEFILRLPRTINEYWQSLPASLRGNLKRKYRRAETAVGVEFKHDLSGKDFLAWYAGYQTEIRRKIFGRDVIGDPIGYFNNHQNLLLWNILAKPDDKVIGGAVMALTKRQLRYKLAWYGQEAKKYNAGYYLVLKCIEWAIDHQLRQFSFGRDTNLYGGHLSLGLHQFKTSFNPRPMMTENPVIKNVAINSNSNSHKKFIFYTLEGKELVATGHWH